MFSSPEFLPLSLPPLVRDYLAGNSALDSFHSGRPSLEGILKRAADRPFTQLQRNRLVTALRRQYADLPVAEPVNRHIELLLQENTFTITSGHQLCFATGPLYVVYKILSAIRLCAQLREADHSVQMVPVLWLATEDHDFEEVNHVFAQGKKVEWQHLAGDAIGRLDNAGLSNAIEEMLECFPDVPMRQIVFDLLRRCGSEARYADGFRMLIHELFSSFGLVIIDGDDADLKASFVPFMQRELVEEVGMQNVSATSSNLMALGYAAQVNPRPVNLFFLSEGKRRRIEKGLDGKWTVIDSDLSFTYSEIDQLLADSPQSFSPNVIIRPLYQEWVLPNLAFIGGPGELSYWLQLRALFDDMSIPFPILVLRDSALLLHTRTHQRMAKIPIDVADLFRDRAQLIRALADESGLTDLESEKKMLTDLFTSVAEKARAVDATLEGAAKAELQKQLNALDQFSKRMMKASKQKEELRISQLEKILDELFPDGGPQERHDNYFDHVIRAGNWFHKDLIHAFNPLDARLKILTFQ